MSLGPWRKRLQQLPQPVQFIGVGGMAAATHLMVVWGLVQGLGMPPLAANVLAFLVAFIVSYNGHALFTFSHTAARGYAVVAKFFAVSCLSFVVNEVLYWIALHWLHWHYFWSLFGVLVLVAVGTFLLSKFWAFRSTATGATGEH